MNEIELKLGEKGRGSFLIEENGKQVAEMAIGILNGRLTVYHTEVVEKLKGQGVAALLLNKMVSYARENSLKVKPLCPYVHAQFKRNPDKYNDIWYKSTVK